VKALKQPEKLSGLLFFILVVAGLVYLVFVVRAYLKDEQQSPIQVIEFSGQFDHVDVGHLEHVIRQTQPGSFFELDVNKVHAAIEQQPWVYRASVRKQWPHTLQIYLVEQTPVVTWNGDMVLNPFGESFTVDASTLSLPSLFGPGGSEVTALEGYNAMALLLRTSDLAIKELSLSERFAWQLQLDNGIKLNLGRQQFMDRLQRFVDVYPLLVSSGKPIEYIDLRYDTGLAVGWQQANDETNEKRTDV
jgi:cell division protein FtsQ